jgi:hypothetical protein
MAEYVYSSEAAKQKAVTILSDLQAGKTNYVSSSGISTLRTSNNVDRPEPNCGYESTQCTQLTVQIPFSPTGQSPQIVNINYFCGNRGSAPIPVGPDTELDWCKIYGANSQIITLPNQKNVLQVQALLKNWSDAYTCSGKIDVEWNYIP